MSKSHIPILAALVLLQSACITRLADLTLVANQSVQIQKELIAADVTGRLCMVEIPAGVQPSLEAVIDEAVRQAPGANALENVSIERIWYPYHYVIFNKVCLEVRGDAVRIFE